MLRIPWSFYVSHWLTFTLAIVCLAVVDSTAPFWLYPLLHIVLTLAMLFANRFSLSAVAANLLGVILVVGWLAWLGMEFYRQQTEGILIGEDWLRVGFIRGGTLLALLLVAKWLRPRNAGDYWMMHALALVQVVLASATLMSRPEDWGYRWFPVLLLGYLACGVWALIVLQANRESGIDDPVRCRSVSDKRISLWSAGLVSGLSWWAVGLTLAVILFLTIPKVGGTAGPSWLRMANIPQSLSGISTGINLNSGDTLRLSEELIVRLEAFDASGNKQWLGDHFRIRVLTCSIYSQGKWQPNTFEDFAYLAYRYPVEARTGQYRLHFQVDLTKLPLAMGVELPLSDGGSVYPLPLVEPHPALVRPRANWLHSDADLLAVGLRYQEPVLWVALASSSRILRYEQLHDRSLEVPETSLPVRPIPPFFGIRDQALSFSTPPSFRGAREFLDTLPRELQASGLLEKFATQVLGRHRLPTQPVPGESADQVLAKAQVLEKYLANNPDEFVYSLSRPRLRSDMDPTEEFLHQPATADGKKAGWCQHYASALALLLRSQRIPARIVIGFRGADWNPAWKTHEIRAYHAHAWVEAFIGPRGLDGRISRGRWVPFDPTPAAALASTSFRQSPWWRMLADDLRYLWETVILDGATGQGFRSFAIVNFLLDKMRLADVANAEFAVTLLRILGAVTLIIASWVLWRRVRQARQQRRQQPTRLGPVADWERQLLDWLQRFLPPRQTGQSLLEYAHAAQRWLIEHACSRPELVSLPVRMTLAYYRFRFANIPPGEQELVDLHRQLDQLVHFLESLHQPNSGGLGKPAAGR